MSTSSDGHLRAARVLGQVTPGIERLLKSGASVEQIIQFIEGRQQEELTAYKIAKGRERLGAGEQLGRLSSEAREQAERTKRTLIHRTGAELTSSPVLWNHTRKAGS